MSDEELRNSQIVYLISGSPALSICGFTLNDDKSICRVMCQWFDGNVLMEGVFCPSQLINKL